MAQMVKLGLASVCSVFAVIFGGWSILLTTLLILNILDMIVGILGSKDPLNSRRLTEGGTRKGIMWMWVLIANLLHLVLEKMGYPLGVSIANWVVIYYIITELVSLEENTEKLGAPIPGPISFVVEKLKVIMNDKFKNMKDDEK